MRLSDFLSMCEVYILSVFMCVFVYFQLTYMNSVKLLSLTYIKNTRMKQSLSFSTCFSLLLIGEKSAEITCEHDGLFYYISIVDTIIQVK